MTRLLNPQSSSAPMVSSMGIPGRYSALSKESVPFSTSTLAPETVVPLTRTTTGVSESSEKVALIERSSVTLPTVNPIA